MLLIRRFEELCIRLHDEGVIAVHLHVYVGQEATAAALAMALRSDDLAQTTHRNHGHILARGGNPGRALAEILGRATGFSGGRAGTFHLSDRASGFLSTSALVGGSIGLAAGAAYALKQQGGDRVSVAFFGDGCLEEGVTFEVLNIAQLWRLPVIFVCENNSRGAAGPSAGQTPSSEIAAADLTAIPRSLGIETVTVDGADAYAVFDAAEAAIARCRRREGPLFLEATTTRWPGSRHIHPKLETGVTDIGQAWNPAAITGEHAAWLRDCDPILRLASTLSAARMIDLDGAHAIDRAVTADVEDARAFALGSPWPDPTTARRGVYA